MGSHSGGPGALTRRHGIRCSPDTGVSVEDCLLAACSVVGSKNIISASRMNKAVVMFFSGTQLVDKIVEQGFVIKGNLVQVSPLATPVTKVILSNVPPFIKNDILERELSRYGKLMGPIKSLSLGCKDPGLKHVQSFRRQAFLMLNNPSAVIEVAWTFHVEGVSCVVFASSDVMKCFKCGSPGHQRKSCPMKEQGHATAGGEEVGGDRGTREEEPASRAPPPGPDLQDHSEPPQPNPQPERDAQRQEKREHSAGEGRIPESEDNSMPQRLADLLGSSTVQFENMTRPLPVFLPPLPLLNGMIFMNKADEDFFSSLEMLRNTSGDVPHSLLCPLHSMAAPLAWSTLLGSGSAVDPARFRLLLWGAEPLIRLGLQPDSLSALPMAGFNPGQIETMMGVFNQHYDVLPPSDREKLLHWVKHCVAMEMFNCSIGQPMGNRGKSEKDPRVKCPPRLRWLKAHTMAVLGRFLSLVPPSELEDIESDELCCFFNHSVSESMFSNMYDLNHSQGRSLLSKLMTGCLDPAHNEESIGRLGALACFYDNVGALSDNASRNLLPLLSDCRNPGIKQLQRQLAEKVLGSGPLTKQMMVTLGPAAPALSLAQLCSLSADDIQDSLASLARVSWRREQASALASKYLSKVQISSPDDLMKMGTLVKGVSSAVLGALKGDQLLRASGLEETARTLSPLQRNALVNAMQRDVNASALLQSLAGSLVGSLALHTLQQASVDSVGVIQGKSWNRGQAAHLVKKLFSRGIQPSDIRMLGSALQGVTCDLIDSIGDQNMLETAAVLSENKAWLSQHQLACSAKKLWAALNRTRADYFGSMNNSELQDVPPVFLLHLTLPQLSSLPARVCPCLLEKLSAVDLSLLPRRSPLRPALREKAFACLNKTARGVSVDDVALLGPLICELSPQNMSDVAPAVFNASLALLTQCRQLRIEQRGAVTARIEELNGKPSDWSAEVVMSLGPLLALFNSSSLRTVSNTLQLKDTLTDLLSSQPPAPLTPAPLDFDTYLNLSSVQETLFHLSTSHQRTRRAVSCPVSPTLQEILDLGGANVHWSPDQLSCMSNKTFVDGLSTLAAVNGFTDQQLAALKGQTVQAWGPPSGYSAEQTLALGCLLPAFNSSELGLVEVSSVDTLSAVAPCSGWTQEKRAALLQRFQQQSLLTPSSLGAVQLAGLGGFLCGMSEAQVSQINVEAYRLAAAMVGAVSCSPSIMGALKSKAVTSFGDVKNWTASELSEIGNVLAGASAAELKTLDPSAMPFISPSAIPLIPADRLAALSVTQLRALGPVNAAMVTGEQAAVLSQAQREALSDAVGVAVERAVVVVVKETGTAAPLKGGSDQLGILGVLVLVLPLLLLTLAP